jgi:hypothetical protein
MARRKSVKTGILSRIAGSGVAALIMLSLAQPASAHPTRSFRACTVHIPGTCISRGAAFNYGDTVRIKGKVVPAHAGSTARVLRRDPHATDWIRVGQVNVSSQGRMRFSWRTRRADAVQDEPYLFKFKIPGHGTSDKTEAYVLFGE